MRFILCILYYYLQKERGKPKARPFCGLFTKDKLCAIQRCKIITGLFCAAGQLKTTVCLQKDFRTAELAVIVITHGAANFSISNNKAPCGAQGKPSGKPPPAQYPSQNDSPAHILRSPRNSASAKSSSFGALPFPSPAIAKPESYG